MKVLEKGFFHDGTWSTFRNANHGQPVDVAHMPAWRLVVCTQNHDQIGNRARGDRLTRKLDEDQLGCAALLTLCSPFTPMLFMGEEWGATTPFQFFTNHPEKDLGEAVAEGRTEEFADMGWDPGVVPDPQAPMTFQRSKLDWSEQAGTSGAGGQHARLLALYRRLAEIRREYADLTDPRFSALSASADDAVFRLRRGSLELVVNFGDSPTTVTLEGDTVVLAATASGAVVSDGGLSLPRHGGALLA